MLGAQKHRLASAISQALAVTGVNIGDIINTPEDVWQDSNGLQAFRLSNANGGTYDETVYPQLYAVRGVDTLPLNEVTNGSPFPNKVVMDNAPPPIGTIYPSQNDKIYEGGAAVNDLLLCDGSPADQTNYPQLYAYLQTISPPWEWASTNSAYISTVNIFGTAWEVSVDVAPTVGIAENYFGSRADPFVLEDLFYFGSSTDGLWRVQAGNGTGFASIGAVVGVWQTLKLVRSGSNFSFYIDGALADSFTATMNDTATPFCLGRAIGIPNIALPARYRNFSIIYPNGDYPDSFYKVDDGFGVPIVDSISGADGVAWYDGSANWTALPINLPTNTSPYPDYPDRIVADLT